MSNSNLILLVVLVVVFAIIVFSYLHKRHHEYKMADIEKAVRKAYVGEATSVSKEELVKVVKTYFHCSSKEALYIIGVARRKKSLTLLTERFRCFKSGAVGFCRLFRGCCIFLKNDNT